MWTVNAQNSQKHTPVSRVTSVDPLSQFLTGPRAHSAFTLRVVMAPPFAVDVRDEAALTVMIALKGGAWIVRDGAAAQFLEPGEAATIRGPAPYLVADAPDTAPTVVIGKGQSCRTPDGEPLELAMSHGVRTWGNSPDGDTVLLIGTYQTAAAAGQLAASALPPLAVFTVEESDPLLVGLLERELSGQGLGQESALDRVLDLLLVHLIRLSVERSGGAFPSWAAGSRDPAVARALAVMHGNPASPWTVAELARLAHISRASMAARFHAAVGQPPMMYLKTWRLALAADRLASSTATTAAIAQEVGYSSAFAFSAAFSKVYGISPTSYRRSS